MTWLTAIIAAIVALIAYNQYRTARDKLRLDLFEKRVAIFNATREYFGEANLREAPDINARIAFFSKAVEPARFLFGDEVYGFLKANLDRGDQLAWAERKRAARAGDRTVDDEQTLREWEEFRKAQDQIYEVFGEYLRFDHIRGADLAERAFRWTEREARMRWSQWKYRQK